MIYLEKTKKLHGNETKLFTTHQKPHKKASRNTIRCWIQQIMASAGIDQLLSSLVVYENCYVKGQVNNVCTADILKAAGWTATTFTKYYDKRIDIVEPLSISM